MSVLESVRREAASGNCDSLVVFLHGFGADGADLIGLANYMSPTLPNTRFVAPNAPEPCAVNPGGFQWFPIPHLGGEPAFLVEPSLKRSMSLLVEYLGAEMKDAGVGAARTVLCGFSQGTMVSLIIAPFWPVALAGVVGFSGRVLDPRKLEQAKVLSRPPVLLVHGDQDQMIPVSALEEAESALRKAGLPVRTHVSRGTGHSIGPDGVGLALGFMKNRLGY